MKKILMHFSENILSRSQMKSIKGGYDEPPQCGKCKSDSRYWCNLTLSQTCSCEISENKECEAG
jgi:natural product precursor